MEKRRIIAIVGPTASGKTGWGVEIAKKHQAEIISADSRQVYRGLNIGTGKDLKEYGEIKHHLIDICDLGEKFTMFDWLERARSVIKEIFSSGKLPIIVGGTGLYVQALVEGFSLGKATSYQLSASSFSRKELESKTVEELQKIFHKLIAKSSKLEAIDMNNPRRLIRAIERAQAGEITSKKKPNFEVLQIAVDLPREELYKRIDQRVEDWFEQGFIQEVQRLLNDGVDKQWLEKIGLEYRILTNFMVDKRSDLEEMKQEMKFAIHAYARRQLTWFRRFPEIVWCKDLKSAKKTITKFLR